MGDGTLDEQKLQRVADAAPELEDKHGALTTIGRSTVADLQQWVRKTAPSFGGWERLEAWDAAGRPGGLEDVLGIDEEQGEALLTHRDEVAAGLSEMEAEVLAGMGIPDWMPMSPAIALAAMSLLKNGMATRFCKQTPFGSAVFHVLEGAP